MHATKAQWVFSSHCSIHKVVDWLIEFPTHHTMYVYTHGVAAWVRFLRYTCLTQKGS